MGDVVPFGRRPSSKNNTLCREGHHKWRVDKTKQFDVKAGKLVTVYICARCGARKTKAH